MRSREPRLTSDLDDALKRAAAADRLLVAVDFDGTLSPIVSNYDSAVADRDALETLFGLAALPRTRVVVISGRSRADLERRIGSCPPEVVLVGSHGAEHSSESPAEEEARVESFMEALNGLRDRYPGTRIERKPYSLAVHYRNVSERRQAEVRDEAIERAGPLAAGTKEGKKVIEFLAVPVDKGTALERYREMASASAGEGGGVTVFIGDDVTDEAAFEVLSPEDVGVKVGPERSAAPYRVEKQRDVGPLLHLLLRLRSREVLP
ncbi:MAG: trehalose-phosphatase [Gemmatimonadota bacterium]